MKSFWAILLALFIALISIQTKTAGPLVASAQITGPQLLLDQSGPDANQIVAFESVLLLRDPFNVRRVSQWWDLGPDPATRVIILAANLQVQSTIVVNLVDNSNQNFNVTPEDVRLVPTFDFFQITFRLPDTIAPGSCKVRVASNNQLSNTGIFRIALGKDAWRQDLQFLATQLPLLHKHAFFKISKAQFDQAVADLDHDIPTLQEHEIVARMMRIVALIGDSHTSLSTDGSIQPFRSFPLKLYWFSDGLYATDVKSSYRDVLGMRLVRIGETNVPQAYTAVSDFISHENEPWLRALSPARLVSPEILQTLRIIPTLRTGRFVFQSTAGQEVAVNIDSVAPNETVDWASVPDPAVVPTPLYRRHPELNYWFDYIESSSALYFQYNVCQNRNDLPFNQFLQQMQAFASTHPVERFIIDLRNNTGGDSSILQPLIFRLPNSRLNVFNSTKLFTTVAGDPPSLFPDTEVVLSSADFLNGRDPVLSGILSVN